MDGEVGAVHVGPRRVVPVWGGIGFKEVVRWGSLYSGVGGDLVTRGFFGEGGGRGGCLMSI